jgi:hypothetical protein
MSYTYSVKGDPPYCKVFSGGTLIDESGPWESIESAETWAKAWTNKLNTGIIQPEYPT